MNYIAIHHTAVSRETQRSQLLPVNRYHKGKWGNKSSIGWYVGYNYFIDVNGSLMQCRKVGERTIAQSGHNDDTISVCLAGNFNQELPLDVQTDRLRDFIKNMKARYPQAELTYHRSLQANRTCPGKLFSDEYLQRVVLRRLAENDEADVEKYVQISKLSKQLDVLISLIKRLLSIFNR